VRTTSREPGPTAAASPLDAAAWQHLAGLAREAIEFGLEHGSPPPVDANRYPASLRERRSAFVTLRLAGELRGCVGDLDARLPLAEAVARNAFNSARDTRFPPLSRDELAEFAIEISVLSPLMRLAFDSEADLLAQLRPGIDGLVLSEGGLRGTFLPAVWQSLPDPRDFLRELKRKAHLPEDHWSDRIEVQRYTTESVPA
jgi:AmmeMemoRadiSam system protein A